jgi:predicted  nucleic acid-binding Zn-ribbon protein
MALSEQNLLSKLQEIDLRIDKLEHKKGSLPEKSNYEISQVELIEIQKNLSKKLKQAEEEERKQKKLEGELDRVTFKIRSEEEKLYGGKITNPKELISIQKEIGLLLKEKDGLETKLLEQLDMVEALDKELKNLIQNEKRVALRTEELKNALNEALDNIDKEFSRLQKEREGVVLDLEEPLYNLYQRLRKEQQGLAVARVKDGICQGCHMQISTEEEDKMLYEERIWRCEHCKRILIE